MWLAQGPTALQDSSSAGKGWLPAISAPLGAELRFSPCTDEIFNVFPVKEERQISPRFARGRGRGCCTRARLEGPGGLIYESDNKNPIRLLSLRKRSREKKLCVSPSSIDAGGSDGSSAGGDRAQGAREGRARAGFVGAAAPRPRPLPTPLAAPPCATAPPAAPPSLLRLLLCRPASPRPAPLRSPALPSAAPGGPPAKRRQPPRPHTCSLGLPSHPRATLPTPMPPAHPQHPLGLGELKRGWCWVEREGYELGNYRSQRKGTKAGAREAPRFP